MARRSIGVGSTAAPLLAGFAFALIGLVVGGDASIRWEDTTLAVLMLAGLLGGPLERTNPERLKVRRY